LDYTLRRRHDPCRMRGRRGAAQQEPPRPQPCAHPHPREEAGRHGGTDL